MVEDRDRFGEKLHERERAEEDHYFAARDRELIAKLKHARKEEDASTNQPLGMRCPKCGEPLRPEKRHDVMVDSCDACKGAWLDHGDLERIVNLNSKRGWLSRYFERIRRN